MGVGKRAASPTRDRVNRSHKPPLPLQPRYSDAPSPLQAALFSVTSSSSSLAYDGLDQSKLLQADRQVEKIVVKHATRAKKVDVRELKHQIMSVVGRATMRQAMEEAKKEMRERNERLDKYESLLLYILDGGSHEDSKVPEEDRLCCENLAILLEHYRTHRWIEGYAYLEDERVTSMITILEGSKSMRVRELLYAPTPTPTGEPIGSPS